MPKTTKELTTELEAFVGEHPHGWGHREWDTLLSDLARKGFDVGDPDRIGLALERERLLSELASLKVEGLGPKRREAVANGYPNLWRLRRASADELAGVPGIHRALAEKLHSALAR